jgi:hypothetical protein
MIVFLSFIPFHEKYRVLNVWEINDDPLFQKLSQTTNKNLLIMGGSAVGQLNPTHIDKIISKKIT